jgi:hypothetical protein
MWSRPAFQGAFRNPSFDLREMVRFDVDEVNTATTIHHVKLTDGVSHDLLSHVRALAKHGAAVIAIESSYLRLPAAAIASSTKSRPLRLLTYSLMFVAVRVLKFIGPLPMPDASRTDTNAALKRTGATSGNQA